MSDPIRVPGGPGRRAIARWAWRLFRREWRQQLLILTLLTIAVAGAVWASIVAVNGGSKAQAELGGAKALARLEATDASAVQTQLAAIEARFGPYEVVAHTSTTLAGIAGTVDIRAQDPNGRYSHSTLALRSGRYPTAMGEVALTSSVADALDAHVGSQVVLSRSSWTVVGLVENPLNLDDRFALVARTTPLPNEMLFVLVGTDPRVQRGDGVPAPQVDLISYSDGHAGVVALVIAAVTASMALVGLIAASGFLVVAQRRQRQLGLVAALGATDRQLRMPLVATGALVGIVAASAGTVIGIAAWLITAPMVERASAHRIDRFDLPWSLLALCVALAIAASMAAAWWPARTVSRVPVMSALSQRPTPRRAVHRSAALAALMLAGGVIAIGQAKPDNAEVNPWLMITGLLAVITGTVLIAPSAIRLLALPARRLPFALRLALRDLVRFQARAAAALAAITLALAVAVATTVVAKASVDEQGPANLSDRQLLISTGGPAVGPFARPVATSDSASLDGEVASLAQTIGASSPLELDFAEPPTTGTQPVEPVSIATPVEHGFSKAGPAFVATPALLARYGIDPSTIRADTDLVTNQSGVVLLDASARPDAGTVSTPTQHADLSQYGAAPRALITAAAMQRHGWTAVRAAWLVESNSPLTHEQLAAARRTADAAGLVVESRDTNDGVATLGRSATMVGAVLALAILAMTLGLIRGEAGADVRTMTAVGAPARTRRAVTATTAASLAIAGVVLASAGAYIAIGAAYRSDLSRLSSPPTDNLMLLALGLPALAAAAGWLLAGRQPSRLARTPD